MGMCKPPQHYKGETLQSTLAVSVKENWLELHYWAIIISRPTTSGQSVGCCVKTTRCLSPVDHNTHFSTEPKHQLWCLPITSSLGWFKSADLQGDGDDIPLLRPCLIDRYDPNDGGEQGSSNSYLCGERGRETKRGCLFRHTYAPEQPRVARSSFTFQTVFGNCIWFADSISEQLVFWDFATLLGQLHTISWEVQLISNDWTQRHTQTLSKHITELKIHM